MVLTKILHCVQNDGARRKADSPQPAAEAFPPTGIYRLWSHLRHAPRSFAGAQDDKWTAGRVLQSAESRWPIADSGHTVPPSHQLTSPLVH